MPTADTPAGRQTSQLYPTKTRLALLRQVAAGRVYEPAWCPGQYRASGDVESRDGRVVTASVDEMRRAGWVRTDATDSDDVVRSKVVLTDIGRDVLAQNPETR